MIKVDKFKNDSLNLATALVDAFEADQKYHNMYLSVPISIHIDAGNSEKGKTRELIPELVGWVRASGYPDNKRKCRGMIILI